jgi:hypothetical protein
LVIDLLFRKGMKTAPEAPAQRETAARGAGISFIPVWNIRRPSAPARRAVSGTTDGNIARFSFRPGMLIRANGCIVTGTQEAA